MYTEYTIMSSHESGHIGKEHVETYNFNISALYFDTFVTKL